MARLGGVLQVVLALWSRLGGRMGPFRADLEPEGGGGSLGRSVAPRPPGRGRPLETVKKTTRQQTGMTERARIGLWTFLWAIASLGGGPGEPGSACKRL